MNLHQLTIFLELSENLNITQVAEKNFTSRQAIQYSIKSLEKEFNTKLFSIRSNKLVLTPDGEELASMAEWALAGFRQLQTDYTKTPANSDRPFTFCYDTATMTKAESLAALYVRLIDEGFANLSIFTDSCDGCLEKVAMRTADVAAVRFDTNRFPKCETVVIRQLPFALYVGTDNVLASRQFIDIADLSGQHLITPPGFMARGKNFIKLCEKNGIDFVSNIVTSSSAAARDMVVKNLGIFLTVTPSRTTFEVSEGGRVIPFADETLVWYDCIIYPPGYAGRAAINTIIDFFRKDDESSIPDLLWSEPQSAETSID